MNVCQANLKRAVAVLGVTTGAVAAAPPGHRHHRPTPPPPATRPRSFPAALPWVSMRLAAAGGTRRALLGPGPLPTLRVYSSTSYRSVRASTGAKPLSFYVGTAHFRGSSAGMGWPTAHPQVTDCGSDAGSDEPTGTHRNRQPTLNSAARADVAIGPGRARSRYTSRSLPAGVRTLGRKMAASMSSSPIAGRLTGADAGRWTRR